MREFTCTACPELCRVRLDAEGNISGNRCPNGAAFARGKAESGGKLFTGKVNILGGAKPHCSVKSSGDIPERLVFAAMEALRSITLFAPVKVEQVLIPDFLGTGSSLISAEDIEEI